MKEEWLSIKIIKFELLFELLRHTITINRYKNWITLNFKIILLDHVLNKNELTKFQDISGNETNSFEFV